MFQSTTTSTTADALFAAMGDHVAIFDRDWRYTYVNDEAARMLGRRREDLIGQRIWDLFPEATGNQFYREMQAADAEQRAAHFEFYHAPWDKWVENHVYPLADGLVLIARDITARKRAEECLRRSEARLRDALDAARMFAWRVDLRTRTIELSENAVGIVGASTATFTTDVVNGWIHADDRTAHEARVRHTLEHGEPYVSVFRVIRPDTGASVWIEDRGRLERDAHGAPVALTGVASDVTPLKRAQDRARLLLELGAALAAAAPDYALTARCIVDQLVPRLASRCMVHVVAADGDLRLAAHAEVRATAPGDTRAPDACDLVVRQALTTGNPIRSHDGLRMYLPLVARGRALGCLSLERRDGESAYGPEESALAEDAARRAALALDNARLYGDLREHDRLKDEFLATLAHELRNPLAPVRHAVELLRLTGAQDERTQGATDVIERQLQQLTRLVDDLLDVSRITRGQVELRKERVALAPLLTRVVESVQPAVRAAGHRLEMTLPATPVAIHGDPVRLGQIFENLLLNASKYTPRGGRIGFEANLAGDVVELAVADTGIGIATDMLPRIFEVFTRAPESRALAGGGLGVGLAIVKRFVEMHGGSVEAKSAGRGQGSRFVVRLPIDRSTPQAAAAAQPTLSERVRTACRVLVVDDNVDSAETLGMLLELMGATVATSHDGTSALDEAGRNRPDIALLDLGLPGMDGYELARQFRASPDLRSVTLVAVTGWGQPEDRRRTRDAGFDHHLVKPVDLDALRALVARAAGG